MTLRLGLIDIFTNTQIDMISSRERICLKNTSVNSQFYTRSDLTEIDGLTEHQRPSKFCTRAVINRKDVFAILQTGHRKSAIIQFKISDVAGCHSDMCIPVH